MLSGDGCATMDRTAAATKSCAFSGTRMSRSRAKCVRHRCHDVPGSTAAIALFRPWCASETISRTPGQPPAHQAAQEGRPGSIVLDREDVHAQDLAVAVRIPAGRDLDPSPLHRLPDGRGLAGRDDREGGDLVLMRTVRPDPGPALLAHDGHPQPVRPVSLGQARRLGLRPPLEHALAPVEQEQAFQVEPVQGVFQNREVVPERGRARKNLAE